ncbi:hypothetical protein D3C77_624230 [compost metagenome]
MGADRAGRGADAVHRHLQAATAAPPPLAQVFQPFLAFVVLEFQVVPHRQVGDMALVRLLQPQRHVGAMVFGDVQARDFHADVEIGGEYRRTQQGTQGEQHAFMHNDFLNE